MDMLFILKFPFLYNTTNIKIKGLFIYMLYRLCKVNIFMLITNASYIIELICLFFISFYYTYYIYLSFLIEI